MRLTASSVETCIVGSGSFGQSFIVKPRVSAQVTRAMADIPGGTVPTVSGHHHSIDNVSGILVGGAPLAPDAPIPFYLAANRRLLRRVASATILCGDIELDDKSELLALRQQQDVSFFGQDVPG